MQNLCIRREEMGAGTQKLKCWYIRSFGRMVVKDRSNPTWLELPVLNTGCHTIQPELTSQIKGKADIFNLAATWELPSLMTSSLSFTSVHMAGSHWMVDAVPLLRIQHAVFGMDRLNPMSWAVSIVRPCWHMMCLTSCLDSASQSYSLCISALLYITSQINLSLQGRECAPGMLEFEPTSQEKECTGHAAE